MLEHDFCAEIDGRVPELLTDDCNGLEVYLENARHLAGDPGMAGMQHFCEHAFEALVEGILRFPNNFLKDYKLNPSARNDFVSGTGERNGERIAVRIFYVAVDDKEWTDDACHVSAFDDMAKAAHEVKQETKRGLYFFSNGQKIHENTIRNFVTMQGRTSNIVFKMREDIEELIDENVDFWEFFKGQLVTAARKRAAKQKPRPHQDLAVEKIWPEKIGQCILPTGTGKTFIESALIEKCIRENKKPLIVVLSPRIMLDYQLIDSITKYLSDRGIEIQPVNFSSGEYDETKFKREMAAKGMDAIDVPSYIDSDELMKTYHSQNKPLVVFSTYHSFEKVGMANIPIALLICDEAHNIVMGRMSNNFKTAVHQTVAEISPDFKAAVRQTIAERKYFFTATQAFTEHGDIVGMDEEEFFGKILFSASPREMMEKGEIVPVLWHFVDVDVPKGTDLEDDIEKNTEFLGDVVRQVFVQHSEKVETLSAENDKIGAKLLVVCKGAPSLRGILESEALGKLRETFPNIKIFAINSGDGAYLNGEEIPAGGNYRERFMDALQNLDYNDEAVILHIDMIGEGIDVPGITGVFIFRELGKIKTSQALGRAMRLHPLDRAKAYKNPPEVVPPTFVPTDDGLDRVVYDDRMIKPVAWMIIPMYKGHRRLGDSVIDMLTDMRNNLGYIPSETFNNEPGEGGNIDIPIEVDLFGETVEVDLLHYFEQLDCIQAAKGLASAIQSEDPLRRAVALEELSKVNEVTSICQAPVEDEVELNTEGIVPEPTKDWGAVMELTKSCESTDPIERIEAIKSLVAVIKAPDKDG